MGQPPEGARRIGGLAMELKGCEGCKVCRRAALSVAPRLSAQEQAWHARPTILQACGQAAMVEIDVVSCMLVPSHAPANVWLNAGGGSALSRHAEGPGSSAAAAGRIMSI